MGHGHRPSSAKIRSSPTMTRLNKLRPRSSWHFHNQPSNPTIIFSYSWQPSLPRTPDPNQHHLGQENLLTTTAGVQNQFSFTNSSNTYAFIPLLQDSEYLCRHPKRCPRPSTLTLLALQQEKTTPASAIRQRSAVTPTLFVLISS